MHAIYKCKHGKIISNCRCPHPEKPVIIVPCRNCTTEVDSSR